MFKFNRILVPVDGSEYAKGALRYAMDLARGAGTELAVLYVSPLIPTTAYITPMGGYAGPYPEQVDFAREYLESLQASIDVPYRMLQRTGDAGTEIVSAAIEEKADIILMATHGRTGLSRLLMGSTAEAVMRHATVPVMTLRAETLAAKSQPPASAASKMTPV